MNSIPDVMGLIEAASLHRLYLLANYLFGAQQIDTTGPEVQPYKYTGKEYDQMHGLNLYDYGARFYDPGLGRFLTMDPLAEKYYSLSPYAYCADNPVRFVDPDGMYIESIWDIASLFMGTKSFVNNVEGGNIGAAIVDGIGVVVDAVAVAL